MYRKNYHHHNMMLHVENNTVMSDAMLCHRDSFVPHLAVITVKMKFHI